MHDAESVMNERYKELQQQIDELTAKVARAGNELDTLFDNISEVFFTMDVTMRRFIQVSQSCLKVFGYAPAEFMDNPDIWKKIIHPEDIEMITAKNLEMLAKPSQVVNRYRVIHKTAGVRRIECKLIPTTNSAGQIVRIDGICRDITESETAEKIIDTQSLALKVSEQKFKLLFGHSLEGLLLARPDGSFQEANQAFCDMLGYSRSELLKLTRQDITVEDDPDLLEGLKVRATTGSYSAGQSLEKRMGKLLTEKSVPHFLLMNMVKNVRMYQPGI